jgi:hypothetical protein
MLVGVQPTHRFTAESKKLAVGKYPAELGRSRSLDLLFYVNFGIEN